MGKEVRQFLRLAWGEWSSRVTGSLSALLVLLGLSISIASAFGVKIPSESIIEIATWCLAAVCGGQAAFSVWVREKRKVTELTERIRPKLKCSFGMIDYGCVRPNTKFSPRPEFGTISNIDADFTHTTVMAPVPIDPPAATYYRLKVECDGVESVSNCRGRLETIAKNGSPVNWEPSLLPFASAHSADALAKRIHKGSPEFLDLMFIADSNMAFLTPPNFRGSSSVDWLSLLRDPAIYNMRINILSDAPTIAVDVSFNWTGNRATSEIYVPRGKSVNLERFDRPLHMPLLAKGSG